MVVKLITLSLPTGVEVELGWGWAFTVSGKEIWNLCWHEGCQQYAYAFLSYGLGFVTNSFGLVLKMMGLAFFSNYHDQSRIWRGFYVVEV